MCECKKLYYYCTSLSRDSDYSNLLPLSFIRFSTRLNGWGKFYFMKQVILNAMCYCHLIDVIGIVIIFALLMSPILYLIHRESRKNGK